LPPKKGTGVDYEITVNDSIGITDGLRGQVRHGEPGKVAPHVKFYSEVLWNHDRQRMERRVMYVDSENDHYEQEWFSLETGERTYFKEGKLSDSDVHGKSARRGKQL
jgi:hypothetical protein